MRALPGPLALRLAVLLDRVTRERDLRRQRRDAWRAGA